MKGLKTILEVEKVDVELARTRILSQVKFSIQKNEIVGLIGPNGSGKTTLFNVINGFIQQQSGTIKLNGQEIQGQRPYQRARHGLGRVFQNFGIFKDMTVLDNMLVALESRQPILKTFLPWNAQSRRNKEKALEFLDQIDLRDNASKKASSLSGGQMRLLEIIRQVAYGADLLLLDEPTAGVSPKMTGQVAELINSLKEKNKTIIIIEHNMNFIKSICDRILVMDSGSIVLEGAPEVVQADPMLQEIYFGR